MKKIYLYIICPVILFHIPSCKKEETPYTITGTLRENCAAPPLAGAYLELFQDGSSLGTSKSQTLYTNADNNGHFSFTYKNSSSIPLLLRYGTASSSKRILIGIPAEKNLDLGDVYTDNKSYLYIKINYASPHTINDTLYYAVTGTKFKHGPFPSVSYDSILARKGMFAGDNSYNAHNESGELVWGLGYGDFMAANNSLRPDLTDYHVEKFSYRGCGYKDTAVINVP
ncbi:MAG: hypothetical protein K0S44_1590 [Bacteroidetes bacterium]|jgi:hypothetical protein|nr:hypothetical protein [Bacteroidota bacterium]